MKSYARQASCLPVAHAELVELAAKWLRREHAIVLTELVSQGGETPDALGWRCGYDTGAGQSTLVECKTSRSDFQADAKKYFRKSPELGIGSYRYFLAPQGLLKADELPDGWGLLEVQGKSVVRVRWSREFMQVCKQAEVFILLSTLRRLPQMAEVTGVSIKYYTMPTTSTATISVERLEDKQLEG